jgi:succinylglutamate desuccinylase
MRISTKGFKDPSIAIVGCLHGNETIGAEVIENLESELKMDYLVKYITANTEAMQQYKRFLDVDLNRSFPWRN